MNKPGQSDKQTFASDAKLSEMVVQAYEQTGDNVKAARTGSATQSAVTSVR